MSLATSIAWDTLSKARFGYTHTWEVEIDYDGVNTQRMGTNYFTIGADDYQPYVVSIAPLEFGVTDDSNVASLASCEIRLRRGVILGSADTMDTRYAVATVLGKAVRIYSQFMENAGARVAMARLIVEATDIEDSGIIRLTCVNDERKLVELPTLKLEEVAWATGYDVPPGYDGTVPESQIVGTVRPTDSLSLKKWQVNRSPGGAVVQAVRYIPVSFADADYRGGAHFNISRYQGNVGVPHYALEYVSGWDAYARLVSAPMLAVDYVSVSTYYDATVDATVLCLRSPNVAIDGYPRAAEIRAMAVEFDGIYSNPTNSHHNTVEGAMQVNTTPVTLTVGGTTKLSLIRGSQGGAPPDYKTSGSVPTAVIRRLCYNVTNVTGTPTLAVYEGIISTDAVGAALVSSTPSIGQARLTLSSSWDCSDLFVKFLVSGSATSVSISDVYLEFEYRSTIRTFERFKIWESAHTPWWLARTNTPFLKHIKLYDYKTVDTSKASETNKLLVAYDGDQTAARSGSYGPMNPTGCLYYILYWLLGIPTGEIDTTTFGYVHAYYVTDASGKFNDWRMGRQLLNKGPAIDVLAELCSQAGILLWRSGDNLWKLAVINHAVSVVATFGDRKEDFPAWDFTWKYTSAFQNAFKFNYRWDPIRQRFGSSFRVDKDATVTAFLTNSKTQCSTAYTAYGAEVEAPDVDLYWVQDSTVAENCAKIIINYATLRRRVVTFKTKLSGMKVEPGDAIQTDHVHQTWAAAGVTFQVRNIRVTPESGEMEITAYEINEL